MKARSARALAAGALVFAAIAWAGEACQSLTGLVVVDAGPEADATPSGSDDDGSASGPGAAGEGGSDASATCQADLTSDPLNCGRCARSCAGGKCTLGICQPVVLAQHLANPGPLAVDKDGLFWMNSDGNVQTCPLAGCTMPIDLSYTTGVTFAAANGKIFVDQEDPNDEAGQTTDLGAGRFVYCPDTGCPADGTGPGTPVNQLVAPHPGFNVADHLIVSGNALFWTDYTGVESCPLAGCLVPTRLATVQNPQSLAVSADQIYWGVQQSGIYACPRAGCGGQMVKTIADGDPVYIWADATNLTWSDATASSIYTCPLAGCSKPTVLARVAQTVALVTDGTTAYWATAVGSIFSCPLSGCGQNPTPLTAGIASPADLVVYGNGLYWIDQGEANADGRVMMIVR
jgi:hypothetical protein